MKLKRKGERYFIRSLSREGRALRAMREAQIAATRAGSFGEYSNQLSQALSHYPLQAGLGLPLDIWAKVR